MTRAPRMSVAILFLLVLAIGAGYLNRGAGAVQRDDVDTKLAVLWTSGDPEVAHRVGLMYTHAANNQQWFDTTRLIIWGPSQKLVIADKDVQAKVLQMMEDGVNVQACVVCANMYGFADELRELGIEVKPMGRPLTDLIQSGWDVLTF